MAVQPLTHHEIVEIVQPFAQRGRHVDLSASDRLLRRLQFKPTAADMIGGGVLAETLTLEGLASGGWRLVRRLREAGGSEALLTATGREAGALLARIEAVPQARHFSSGEGFVTARDYVIDADNSFDGVTLVRAHVRLDALQLKLTVPEPRRMSGDIELSCTGGALLALPEDLLAVLGWSWARLLPGRTGLWSTKLRLRGSPAARTQRAEAALGRVAVHLARTLREPPARFHERLLAARWGVVFRRGIPMLMAVSLLASVALLPRFDTGDQPGLWVLMYHLPTALIALSFSLQEMARFEIPPVPRRSAAASWRLPAAGPNATGQPSADRTG